jgi:hypothetical protein
MCCLRDFNVRAFYSAVLGMICGGNKFYELPLVRRAVGVLREDRNPIGCIAF